MIDLTLQPDAEFCGWRVALEERENRFRLTLVLRSLDDNVERVPVWVSEDKSVASVGACSKFRLLLEGIARFLNAGGEVKEIAAVQFMLQNIPDFKLVPKDQFFLLGADADTVGEYVFSSTDENNPTCIIWREDESCELASLNSIEAELGNDYGNSADLFDTEST